MSESRIFVTPSCDICSDVSVAMLKFADGCTCIKNIYQRRCMQHIDRVADLEYEIVEDYTVDKLYSKKD